MACVRHKHSEQLRDAAEAIAAQAMMTPQTVLPCELSQGDATCRDTFITDFGARVFRRPLTELEVNRYVTLFDLTEGDDGFGSAAELVIIAMLQSPSFLYRHELGVSQADGVSVQRPPRIIRIRMAWAKRAWPPTSFCAFLVWSWVLT